MERLYRALEIYSQEDYYPFHMPGHKRNPDTVNTDLPFDRDITEIEGFDNLHHPEGILKKAQETAANVYGTKECYYSVNGSTAALLAAVSAAVPRKGQILVARNCHKAVYHALYLRNLIPTYVYPQMDQKWWINGGISPDKVERALAENPEIKAVLLTSPTYDGVVSDIEKIADIAHAHKIPLVVDNTFATPYLVRPIEYGADIVIHSATKFIGGHGTTIGGVIVDSGKFDWEASGKFASLTEPNPSYHGISFTKAVGPAAFVTKIRAILLRDTGATISPIHSFIFLQGLETLSLRVERHVENALKVVDYLNNHPLVEKVNHPAVSDDPEQQALYKKYFPNGGGSIFTFEIKGDAQKAKDFIDNLELFSLLANVADVKSLVIHPATTTHSQCTEEELLDQGIKPNTIRLSIGTEHIDDIIQDLDEAFKAVE